MSNSSISYINVINTCSQSHEKMFIYLMMYSFKRKNSDVTRESMTSQQLVNMCVSLCMCVCSWSGGRDVCLCVCVCVLWERGMCVCVCDTVNTTATTTALLNLPSLEIIDSFYTKGELDLLNSKHSCLYNHKFCVFLET